ncbi:hypothetical protein FPV67DRAFT_1663906 [Lyophyllum atratum]|nr:hypothetical protein FPV67DRAFT_1663906 [Lyophyllum atratum]
MYADCDSDVDSDGYFNVEYPPFLTLYGAEEARSRTNKNRARVEAIEQGKDAATVIGGYSEFYLVVRFFKSVEGFYTGSLDLTGRHLPRYIDLITRWNLYLVDFITLTAHVKEFETDTTGLDGEPLKFVDYDFEDEILWEDFQTRWKIPMINGYGQLGLLTAKVLSTISRNPMPRIQQLCLVQLPPEVLDHIFWMSNLNQMRLLSSTCRHLNNIGSRHIYKSRTITFDVPWDVLDELRQSDNPVECLKPLAYSIREELLLKTNFLIGRPDLIAKIENLTILDEWTPSMLDNHGFDLWTMDAAFYPPIYKAFTQILSSSFNVTTLALQNISITSEIIRLISDLHHLHSVRLRICLFTFATCEWIQVGHAPLWKSVYNLHILPLRSPFGSWYSTLLCPHLRTFSAQGVNALPGIPGDVALKFPSFPTLERLTLTEVLLHHVPYFAAALSSRPGVTFGRLTHFKLHVAQGCDDDAAMTMLNALSQGQAPLQALVLEGLTEGDFRLFDHIAHSFPRLLGLTLLRRESDWPTKTMYTVWPHSAWEYASHLHGLSQLQHFGWNNYTGVIHSSAPLLRFEEGFYDPEMNLEERFKTKKDDSVEVDKWTPAVFAAHCPSLRSYTPSSAVIDWYISRTPSGAIVMDSPTQRGGILPWVMKWNPVRLGGHWPIVEPAGTIKTSTT